MAVEGYPELKQKTEFVAEAIKAWITDHENAHGGSGPGDTLKVFDRSHEELSSGHIVSWEGGFDNWIEIFKYVLGPYVTFMGCWLEPVNHYTLAVYESGVKW